MDNISPKKEQSRKPRILIVGGVAGGASCAARLRRLSEDAEIIVFERGSIRFFCQLRPPILRGNVITQEKKSSRATPELIQQEI